MTSIELQGRFSCFCENECRLLSRSRIISDDIRKDDDIADDVERLHSV